LTRRERSSALTMRLSSFANKLRSNAKSSKISRVESRSIVTIPATLSYSLSSRLRC
jgi:hypothetical protein